MVNTIKTKGFTKRIVSFALALILLISMTTNLQYKASAQMSLQQMTDANIIAVESGSYHVIALDEDGAIWSLGQGTYGRLGTGSTSNQSSPQKITTTYDGSPMPVIKQISVSQQNSLALDVNGNVWVWGWNSNGSIGVPGISGNVTRPMQIPALSNITYISSAYLGGRAIDANGALWVWGRNYQSSIGDASSSNVTEPKKLTQGFDSDGSSIDISTEKFVAVAASDYFDQMCNMALTENGTIYTWGNNNNSSYGGSTKPKKVIAAHSSSSIQTLPTDIKKIDVCNGGFSFLDDDGNIWTWGAAVIVTNKLGHGNTTSYALPKKVDYVKMSTGGSAQAAPKFVDYSRYAWSMMAVDVNGNIYGCGESQYSHHMGIGSQNTLTKYAGPTLVDAANNRITKVSEGYYISTYIDIHGNLYYTGNAGSGYGSDYDETYVRFPNVNTKIRFTNIESTPDRGQHLYSNETVSLKVTVNTPVLTTGSKIKYVKIYKGDPNYELAVASNTGVMTNYGTIGNQILMRDTNPQLLISESYALASSQFYANTKISKAVFDSAYTSTEGTDKGELTAVTAGLTYVLSGINDNCMIWLQTEGTNGGNLVTNRMIYVYESFYKNVEIYHQGVRNDNGKTLYSKELVQGNYGLYYNYDGSLYDGVPPLGYDTVKAAAKSFYYWTLDPINQEEDKKIVLDDIKYASNDTLITFTYSKNPDNWWTSYIHYVKYEDISQTVQVEGNPVTEYPMFAPKDANSFAEGDDPFYAPKAVGLDDDYAPIGYILGDNPDVSNLVLCDFPEGFNPKVARDNEKIYVVYKSGTRKITEKYMIEDAGGILAPIPANVQSQTEANIDSGANYGPKYAPSILGYVAVDWAIDDNGIPLRQGSLLGNVAANIQDVTDDLTVYYIYKIDGNNNGIPDDYEGKITVKWIGKNADSTETNIHEEIFTANGYAGDKIFLNESGTGEMRNAEDISYRSINLSIPLNNWIFVTIDNNIQYPNGIDTPLEAVFIQGAEQRFVFYYEYDSNDNDVADKYEGHITEYYQDADGNKIAEETFDKYLEGGSYSKTAPKINNYVAVEVRTGTTHEDAVANNTPQGDEPKAVFGVNKNGNAVIFVYKLDINNNGIPDDVEGKVTVQWVGVTASGTDFVMHEETYYGFGAENKIDTGITYANRFVPNSKWLFDTGLYDTPERDVFAEYGYSGEWYFEYTFNHENEQTLKFYFDEDYNENSIPDRLEPVKITVIGQYNGNEIYSYVINKGLAEKQFKIDAWTMPTYRFASGYAEQYKSEIDGSIFITKPLDMTDVEAITTASSVAVGTQSIEINPRLGHQTVYFNYGSNMSAVRIKAMYGDINKETWTSVEIPSFTSYTLPAEIGKPFSADAPYIEGYTNRAATTSSGAGAYIPSIGEAGDEIIFYYVKNTGNLTVVAYEDINNNGIYDVGEEIGTVSRLLTGMLPIAINTADSEAPSAAEILLLSNFNLAAGSGLSTHSYYNGIDNVTLTYKYVRKTRNVIAEAWDVQSNTKIGKAAPISLGVGLVHNISAPNSSDISALANYTLNTAITANVQSLTVDNASAGDITIKFWYNPNAPGTVRVIAYYNDGEQDIVIQSYVNSYPSGIAVIIEYPKFHGWKLAESGVDSYAYVTVTPNQTATKEVKFRYEKDTYKISISFNPNTITPPVNFPLAVEIPKGDGYQISVPSINGYTAAGMRINGEYFADLSINLVPESDVEIEFLYEAIVINRYSVVVNIKLGDESESLYETILVNSGEECAVTPPARFGYVLYSYVINGDETVADGDFDKLVLPNVTADIAVLFIYKQLMTIIPQFMANVTVKGVNAATRAELYSYTVSKPKYSGEFTVTALPLNGYEFVSRNTVTLDVQDTDLVHVFEYRSTDIEVTINAELVGGGSIPSFTPINVIASKGLPFSYNAPYIKGYNLAGDVTEVIGSVDSGNKTITFKYEQAVGNVTVVLREADTNRVIKTQSRVLTMSNSPLRVDIPDLSEDYYTAVYGQSTQSIVYDGNSKTVEYYYTKNTRAVEVAAKDSETGDEIEIIQAGSYRVGETALIDAIQISGYALAGDNQRLILVEAGVGAQRIVFNYTPVVTVEDAMVTIVLKDGANNSIAAPVNVQTTFLVPKGSNFTAFAPHVEGYVLTGEQSIEFADIQENVTAVFVYMVISNVRTDLEIIFNDVTSGTPVNIGGSKILNLLVDNEYRYTAPDFTDAGYEFVNSAPEVDGGIITINLTIQNNVIVINYTKILVPVKIRHVNSDTQDVIIEESINAPINTVYIASPLNPSEYSDYKWIDGENRLLVTKTNSNIITLEYQRLVPSKGTIVIRHMAKTEDGSEWILSLEPKAGLLQGEYIYRLTSENEVKGYLDEGYTLITIENPTAQIGTDSFVDVYYLPETVEINVSYVNSVTSELLATDKDEACVGELYVPSIKVFEGYIYEGFNPIGGIKKVSRANNSISVNYREKDINYSAVTAKYLYNGNIIGTPVVVLNQVVGSRYSYSAPEEFISGKRKYALAGGEVNPKTITVASAENEIVFNYEDKGSVSSTIVISGGGGGGGSPAPDKETETKVEEEQPNVVLPQSHVSYLNGYGDGTIRPDNSLRRAEFAVMLFKIIEDKNKNVPTKSGFSDIEAEKWYTQAINYLAFKGILNGYKDGTFMPEQVVTRAEVAAVAARICKNAQSSKITFTDVSDDHWAIGYIKSVYGSGFIIGYPDGTFRPQNSTTRAEAVKIINAMLNRRTELADIPSNVPEFTDLSREQWFYCDIIEACTQHNYERKDNEYEVWK